MQDIQQRQQASVKAAPDSHNMDQSSNRIIKSLWNKTGLTDEKEKNILNTPNASNIKQEKLNKNYCFLSLWKFPARTYE